MNADIHDYNMVPWASPDLLNFDDPTRVAFAGCWHGKHLLAVDAINAAHAVGAQVIVHTGDVLYTEPVANRMLDTIEQTAAELGMFIVVVRGNHDDPALYRKAVVATRRRRDQADDGFARLSPHVLHAPNGYRWTWQGVSFAALGGAYSVDRPARIKNVTYWPGEVASHRDMNKVSSDGHVQVLVTHDIPFRSHLPLSDVAPSWWDIKGANAHRVRIQKVVDQIQPEWMISGHMHRRFSDSMYLPVEDGEYPVQTRLEILDKIESGVEGNLMVCDLNDGQIGIVQ